MATNLPAGPELDRLACEALTRAGCAGWGPLEQSVDVDPDQSPRYVQFWPRISKSWAIAGRALEAMQTLSLDYMLDNLGHPPNIVRCIITKWDEDTGTEPFGSAEAPTGPHAIALALIAALPCE